MKPKTKTKAATDADAFYNSGLFSPLDIHFARFIQRLEGTKAPEIPLAALLVSRHQRMGHICLNLADIAGKPPAPEAASLRCPTLTKWRNALKKAKTVGEPGAFTPLIFDTPGDMPGDIPGEVSGDDPSRLYLHKFWQYQQTLADKLREMATDDSPDIDIDLLKDGLARFFGKSTGNEPDWQKVAAFAAVTRRFCVISGGPGTGKTTTVAKILALLLEQALKQGEAKSLHIALVAPTGKAAARLISAIRRESESSAFGAPVRERMPDDASTVHRLLGAVPGTSRFRHNAENPVPADLVVVDEASMVDLSLMSRLVHALRPSARLILLGDKDQLASVEAGAVLGDICDVGRVHRFSRTFCEKAAATADTAIDCTLADDGEGGIGDGIVVLRKSYRFDAASGIGHLSRAVVAGDDENAWNILSGGAYPDLHLSETPELADLEERLSALLAGWIGPYFDALDAPEAAFAAFDGFRILCALRRGPFGAEAVNRLAEEVLRRSGRIRGDQTWYAGRPVMVTRNDYANRLFNGDIGICLPDGDDGTPRVFFQNADGGYRALSLLRLPEHETVFAMTVHKSQGSEFDAILLLFPDQDAPVLTRELVYTAITRARKTAEIWTPEEIFRTAVKRPTARVSGLRDAIWRGAA